MASRISEAPRSVVTGRRRWLGLGLLAGGVVVGVSVSAIQHRHKPPAPETQQHEQDQLAARLGQANMRRGSNMEAGRLASLEAKVAALETGSTPAAAPSVRPPLPPHPTAEQRQAMMEEDYRQHQERVSKTMAAPRVEPWASEMERKLDEGMKAAQEMRGKYQRTDCRADSCVVKVSWPSRSEAENGMVTLMGLTARSGCARQIALPPPSGADDKSFESVVLVDCAPRQASPAL